MKAPMQHILTPENSLFVFVDLQPQKFFALRSIDAQILKNNVLALAKTAKIFNVPALITSIESETTNGFVLPELLDVFHQDTYERTAVNFWEDKAINNAIKLAGRKKIVLCGLWTCACINLPAMSAIHEGYDVYIVGDASGDISPDAQYSAMRRAEASGALPVTSLQLLLEMQRDWAHLETYEDARAIIREHFGAYGMGMDYADTHVNKIPQRGSFPQLLYKKQLNAIEV